MSLFNRNGNGEITPVNEGAELEYVNESTLVDMITVALMEGCTEEEIEELVAEAANGEENVEIESVMERSIVKLDKNAKKNQAFKISLLSAAKDAGSKEYKKLVKLWKLESVLMKKIEKRFRSEADKRARVLIKTMGKSKKAPVVKVAKSNEKRMLKTSTTKLSK